MKNFLVTLNFFGKKLRKSLNFFFSILLFNNIVSVINLLIISTNLNFDFTIKNNKYIYNYMVNKLK